LAHPRLGAFTWRSAAASIGAKATSLAADRVGHAAWCMPSPRARQLGINRLGGLGGKALPAGARSLALDRAIFLGVRRTVLEEPCDSLRDPVLERRPRLPVEEVASLPDIGHIAPH